MRTIFNITLLLLLFFIFFRLSHISKEKILLKAVLKERINVDKARHYRYLTIFQFIMHGSWILISLYFVYYFFLR